MNRINNKFKELNKIGKKAFVAFLTAGDPTLEITEQCAVRFAECGVDILELGIPFSDPLADGPTIQASSQRALVRGVNIDKIFEMVKRIRRKSGIPIALMGYYNPIFRYGEDRFVKKAKACGVDGVIIPDLPPEEARELIRSAQKEDLATVFFVAPTTKKERVPVVARATTGFIYYVSIAGVTGARRELPKELIGHVKLVKRLTKKPVCVGFGISSPEQVRSIAEIADGVIVGSAIINHLQKDGHSASVVDATLRFVKSLAIETKREGHA